MCNSWACVSSYMAIGCGSWGVRWAAIGVLRQGRGVGVDQGTVDGCVGLVADKGRSQCR